MTGAGFSDALALPRDTLHRLGVECGSVYVYDLDAMRRNATELRAAFSPVRLYYAIKANPLQEVVLALNSVLDGLEVASSGELRYVLGLGVPPSRVLFGGPAKSDQDILDAVWHGIHALHLDTCAELEAARAARHRSGSGTFLAVRANTLHGVSAPFDNMVGGSSRFGIDEELLLAMAARGELKDVDGVHLYSGSQLRSWRTIAGQFVAAASLVRELQGGVGGSIRYVNVGGGFGVTHAYSDPVLAVDRLPPVLHALTAGMALGQSGEVALELGRYLSAPYGALVTTIRGCKESRGARFVFTDCGYNGFLRPSLTGEEHRIVRLADPSAGEIADGSSLVCGPLCTPTDTFGTTEGWVPGVGEVVAILNAGAYGWSMSPHFFLGHPTVAEAVIDEGEVRIVRKRLEAHDYMSLGRSGVGG